MGEPNKIAPKLIKTHKIFLHKIKIMNQTIRVSQNHNNPQASLKVEGYALKAKGGQFPI